MMKILVIEDNNDINEMIVKYLTNNNYQCTSAFSGTEGLLLFNQDHYDLIILDLMLPGLDGEKLLSKIRESSNIPVIVLTAKDSLDSKVGVLGLGADDYLCKPFELEELLARIQVQLRKRNKPTGNLIYKNLILQSSCYDGKVDGHSLSLTKHEYLILELLMKNTKRVFTKQEIYEYAWNDTFYDDDKTINTHISNIRKKLSRYSDEKYIKTVWGIGFKMAE
ncbi:response regulator transcription factor [Thomasclavelia sp.]|uniref:response regulator transcription factor n=1 Tax=Thomasclavelia sp. TaxID=3025757 RepID=UPI0025DFA339|nr:response regulator transcription factor [Thomasclavelia sp.]